jgi:hypothetical protein
MKIQKQLLSHNVEHEKNVLYCFSFLLVLFLTAQTCSYGGISTGLAAECVGTGDVVCDDTDAYQCQMSSFGTGYFVTRAPYFDAQECGSTWYDETAITSCSSSKDCDASQVCLPIYDVCYDAPEVSCTDTDEMNDPHIAGEISGIHALDGSVARAQPDACTADGAAVWEFYCEGDSDYIAALKKNCDSGERCLNGACVSLTSDCETDAGCAREKVCAPYTQTCQDVPTTTCVDTDEANSPYVGGTITGTSDYDFEGVIDFPDHCTPDLSQTVEYYCHSSGYISAKKEDCAFGESCNPSTGICEDATEVLHHGMSSHETLSRETVPMTHSASSMERTATLSTDLAASVMTRTRFEVAPTTSSGTMTPEGWSILSITAYGGLSSGRPSYSYTSSAITSLTKPTSATLGLNTLNADCGGTVYTGTVGEDITFDGSASTGNIDYYSWDWDDGTSDTSISGVGSVSEITHAYKTAATYTATLTVTSTRSTTDSCDVSVIIS